MATLLIEHPLFQRHLVPPGHPERPDRLGAVAEGLAGERFAGLVRRDPPLADIDTIAMVHTDGDIDEIRGAVPESGIAQIEFDTFISAESFTVARHAVGAAVLAVDEVMGGGVANAFAAVRPPGHHAGADFYMGFCLFNNAAIAARYAQRAHGAERVAIVDWDVHHGNGTQAIFWSDPTVLYCSTHQMPLYPGTGARSETGVGNVVNAPLAPGDGGAEFRTAFNESILPAMDAFAPDLIVVSCGFDAHERDPLASINLTDEDFAWATMAVMEIADRRCAGRIVSLLEGGYDLQAIAESTAAHVAALMNT